MENIILIVGCNSSTGVAVSEKMQSQGWRVIGIDDEKNAASSLYKYYVCDPADRPALIETVSKIEREDGKIYGLYTALDKMTVSGFENTGSELWKQNLNYILGGTVNACAAAAPAMVQRNTGRIVLLSPDYRYVQGDCILEAAAAGTIYGFGKSFGVEVAPDNVMVNILSPNLPYDLKGIADTVAFLIERGDYITGQVVSIVGA